MSFVYQVLLVDDDPYILTTMGPALELEGYRVTTAESGQKAMEAIEANHFDLILTDLFMDNVDGIDVLKKAKRTSPETMVIIITGFGDMTSAIDALRLKADDYMLKPCEPEEVFFRINNCLEKLEYKRKIKAYEEALRKSRLTAEEVAMLLGDGGQTLKE